MIDQYTVMDQRTFLRESCRDATDAYLDCPDHQSGDWMKYLSLWVDLERLLPEEDVK